MRLLWCDGPLEIRPSKMLNVFPNKRKLVQEWAPRSIRGHSFLDLCTVTIKAEMVNYDWLGVISFIDSL